MARAPMLSRMRSSRRCPVLTHKDLSCSCSCPPQVCLLPTRSRACIDENTVTGTHAPPKGQLVVGRAHEAHEQQSRMVLCRYCSWLLTATLWACAYSGMHHDPDRHVNVKIRRHCGRRRLQGTRHMVCSLLLFHLLPCWHVQHRL